MSVGGGALGPPTSSLLSKANAPRGCVKKTSHNRRLGRARYRESAGVRQALSSLFGLSRAKRPGFFNKRMPTKLNKSKL
eukprot:700460-Prorocentrum_minimum.AAC.1